MLRVIGAGLGRTGTNSLKLALEQLGFNKCYHMIELIEHPEHQRYWDATRDGTVDWQALFSGYQAGVDYPVALFYKDLMRTFPAAKVILTVRDPERWYDSVRRTIYYSSNPKAYYVRSITRWFFPAIRARFPLRSLVRDIVWNGQFEGRFEDKDFAIAEFERWNEEVKQTVPAEKLLVYEAGQGWEPLCNFLNVAVPDTPYPHVNSSEEFKQYQIRNPWKRALGF